MVSAVSEPIVLVDFNSGDTPHPYLVFDQADGTITIADDYETTNDRTARNFTLSLAAAVILATELLLYARVGTPSSHTSVSQDDIQDALERRP
jgi:hypothetical protein